MLTALHLRSGVRESDAIRELMDREVERLDRRLGRRSEGARLRADLGLEGHAREGVAHLSLSFAGGQIHAAGRGHDTLAALRDAFAALEHELARARRRTGRRQAGKVLFALDLYRRAPEPQGPSADDWRLLQRTEQELERFLRREIKMHRERLGYPEPGEIDVDDLVEEALLRAASTSAERPDDVPIDRWAISAAYDVLIEEEARLAERSGLESLDEGAGERKRPEDGEADPRAIFEGPHDAECVSDRIDDREETDPLQAAQEHEAVERAFDEALSSLGDGERDVLRRWLENGHDPGTLARETGRSGEEIRHILERGLERLGESLVRHGWLPG